eukprot:8846088-Pyramimonas_sp.AAC.1
MEGVVWSSKDAQGPQRRLQTANQGVQYVKGVRHRMPGWGICNYRRLSDSRAKGVDASMRGAESGVPDGVIGGIPINYLTRL